MAKTKTRQISYDSARGFVIESEYNADVIASIRSLPRRKWDAANKVWTAPTEAVNTQPIRELAAEHSFSLTEDASQILAQMATAPLPKPQVCLTAEGYFQISFGKDVPDFYELLNAVKSIDGRQFRDSDKTWLIPCAASSADGVASFVTQFNADTNPETIIKLKELLADAERIDENRSDLFTKSTAASSDFEVGDFGVDLYPFQKAGVEYALQARRTFIADEQGLGKTFQAIATVHAANAFPAIVVCQGNMKYGWYRAWQNACPNRVVDVLSGKKPSRIPECDVVVINYDILDAWKDDLLKINARSLINDESHNLKSPKTKRTLANLALAKQIPSNGLVLNLTGTSVLNRPKELASQLDILGRKQEFGGFKFFTRYCGAYRDRFGWNMNGATNLDELNTKLRESCFVRRLKADVLKDLPAKQRAIIPIEIPNMAEYRSAEGDVIAYLRKAADDKAEIEAQEAGLTKEERKKMRQIRSQTAEARAAQAETLVQIQTLKQIAAKGKIDAAVEWVEDFIESEKLVLFVHHRAVASAIIDDKRLAKSNMAVIRGGMTAEEKQVEVDKFQDDDTCRLIVCSLKAANTGITLTAASNVAFLELGWTPAEHDQAEDRCHRIGQQDSVTAWYLIAQDTIDENVVDLIEKKRKVTTAIMDGEQSAGQTSILRDLMRSMLRDDVEDL